VAPGPALDVVVPDSPAQADTISTRHTTTDLFMDATLGGVVFTGNKKDRMGEHYTPPQVSDTQLYFAYASLLDPRQLTEAAPGARFLFSAHFPEVRLVFVANGAGPVASLVASPGSTVWGGVFEVPRAEVDQLVRIEAGEGRTPTWEMKAVDRAGNKHDCLAFVTESAGAEAGKPSADYLATMIRGARHWNLPAGWVVGLEDLADDHLLS